MAKVLGANGYPYEFIFDKKGLLRSKVEGYTDPMKFSYASNTINEINNLLDEK